MDILDRSVRKVFVQLADTLTSDFDVIEYLANLARQVVDLVEVDAAGLLLVDQCDSLNLVAASTEQARFLELFQLRNAEGPSLDCFRGGLPVELPDFDAAAHQRWPRFSPAARQAGFTSLHALPMRLHEHTIGAMNLFSAAPGPLARGAVDVAQALTDMATVGIIHQRAFQRQESVIDQLQTALDSRVLIEQAKGVLAERCRVPLDIAFEAMRRHARSNRAKLVDIAQAIAAGRLDIPTR